MSRTSYSSYERDLQRPSVEVLPNLGEFLEISIDDVLTLYGGTCIEALRPALAQFLATRNVNATVKDVAQVVPEVKTTTEVHPVPEDRAAPRDHDVRVVPLETEVRIAQEPASSSIFANELSHASHSTWRADGFERQDRNSKVSKGKNGKKKKKKAKK